MINLVKSLLTEYGLKWTMSRGLYFIKLKMMSIFPFTEKLYEKKVSVKRIDIFDFNTLSVREFLIKLDNNKKDDIISIADKAIDGVITGFSSIELNYGKSINWHLNPLTGFESRRDIKWYKIPDFCPEKGDIKVVWEASRFTHFLYFCRAYLITGNVKYYKAFSHQLEDWLKNNPYSYGANYKCGQEATLRMINTLIAYSVFRTDGIITSNDKINVIRLVEDSYKKVLSNFFYAHKCIRNNHTFTEILGLIIGAWCCKNEPALRKSYKLMDEEIIRQFLNDGGFTQYSFNYQRFVLQIIECLFKISEKTGIYIKEKDRIKNSILLMYQVQAENGDVPNYGSNDGALIFPLTSCGYRDYRPVLNTLYALIEGKRLYRYGDYDEELLWFTNKKEFPFANIKKVTSSFNDIGLYTFRHDGGFLMTCLQSFKSRPSHMDQLHIDLWHNDINILCDSGTYSYASEIGKELSATAAHNTVKLFNTEQMNKRGIFLVTNWTESIDVTHNDKSFSGTMVSKNGYKHKRSIYKVDYGYLIKDNVEGRNSEYCDFNFHTPCDVKIEKGQFLLFDNDKIICTIKTSGEIEVNKTYRSLYYLKKDIINCVTVRYKITNKMCKTFFEIII